MAEASRSARGPARALRREGPGPPLHRDRADAARPCRESTQAPGRHRWVGERGSDELLALHVLSQPRAELRAQVVALGAELDRRLKVVEGIPDVEAPALETVGVYRLLLRQQVDRIRELDLASATRRGPSQRVEDLRREHVSADHGEVGWRLPRRRLLDDRQDP